MARKALVGSLPVVAKNTGPLTVRPPLPRFTPGALLPRVMVKCVPLLVVTVSAVGIAARMPTVPPKNACEPGPLTVTTNGAVPWMAEVNVMLPTPVTLGAVPPRVTTSP